MDVKEINPIITKQYVRNSIRGTKTDKTDAMILAKIGVIEGRYFRTFNRSEEEILLKKKISLIANLETALQSMKAGVRAYHEGLKKV
ncbi:MAG: IS110 family transposase [Candidatus Peribacteria bacterium]|nr:IS110 family transposase [Candidatus Peribacteria bacterium]